MDNPTLLETLVELSTLPTSVLDRLDWIPLRRYLEFFGENKETVRKRITSGKWQAGVVWSRPEGAGIWVSLKGLSAWAAVHKASGSEKEPPRE